MVSQILVSVVALFQGVLVLLGVILIFNGLKILLNKGTESRQSATTRRRLGKHEILMNLQSEKRQGTVEVSLIFSLRSETKLHEKHVRQALVLLAKRQPMLRAIITTSPCSLSTASSKKDTFFDIIDGNEIASMIDFKSSEVKARHWQHVWNEVASKQRGTRLLWKGVMLKEEFLSEAKCYANTLIFNFNHCIVDGVSTMKFCQQFLHYLNGLAEGSFTSKDDVCSLGLAPSLMDLLTRKRPSSLWQILARCLGISGLSRLIFKKAFRQSQSQKQRNPFFAQFPPNAKSSASPD